MDTNAINSLGFSSLISKKDKIGVKCLQETYKYYKI